MANEGCAVAASVQLREDVDGPLLGGPAKRAGRWPVPLLWLRGRRGPNEALAGDRAVIVAEDLPMLETFRGVLPFLASDVLRVILLVAFPGITLWLVRVL